MGMFSWECKGCDQELVSGEEVRLDGSKGEYDGYGRAGNFEYNCGEPVAWHQKCYSEATDAEKLDETPSVHARNQGFGYPQAQCMPESTWGEYTEPPRLFYKDIPSEQIIEYIDSIFSDDEKKDEDAYSFLAGGYRGDGEKLQRGAVTDGDVERAKLARGNRFSHEVEHEPMTDGGVPIPRTAMEIKYPTTFVEISELAHDALNAAKRRAFKQE